MPPSGGGGAKLGGAYGEIRLDAAGVIAGVQTAVAALRHLQGHLGRIEKIMGIALGAAAGVLQAALVGVVTKGVSLSATLEQKMADIQAAMQISTDAAEQLRQKILELGLDPNLKVSTLEAASAIELLGKNGLSTKQILDGAAYSTVLLANATDAQFNQAANIATDVMALFGIQAANMQQAVDGITGVVNNSKFSINDYALGIAQAGGQASLMGVPFEDFNAALAGTSMFFASGSDSGTSFKNFLMRLAAPTQEQTELMTQLGLATADGRSEFFDANGQLKSFAEISTLLNTSLAGLSEQQRGAALTTLFLGEGTRTAEGLARLGAVAYTDAADAAEQLGVSVEEATKYIEGGITGFESLLLQIGETSAVDSAAIRMNTLSGSVEILQGVLETLLIQIGDQFKPTLKGIVDSISVFLSNNGQKIVAFFRVLAAMFNGFITVIRSFFNSFSGSFSRSFGAISQNAEGWGRNITISLARGIVTAAVAVVQALTYIGRIITSWLKPGSPPALLPDLDVWGAGAMNAYLEGFGDADFGIFNEIAGTVEQYLRAVAPEDDIGLIPRILGSREAIAAIIAQIRETGEVGEESFAAIEEITGELPDSIRNYIQSLFQLEIAQQAVADAESNLQAIRDLSLDTLGEAGSLTEQFSGELATAVDGYVSALQQLAYANERVEISQNSLNAVTERYDNILSPLNEQLEGVRSRQQEIRDNERLAQAQEVLNDVNATAAEKEQAALEMQEILLRRQIAAVEEQKETAVDAAQAQLDAAEEAQEAAEAAAQAAEEQALTLAESQLQIAQAQLDSTQQQVNAAQELIGVQQENNDLLEEQIDLLEQLSESMEGIGESLGSAMEGVGEGLSGLGEGMGDGLMAGIEDAIPTGNDLAESIVDPFTQSIDQLVEEILGEFTPLEDAATELGTVWGETFATMASFIETNSVPIKGALMALVGLLSGPVVMAFLGLLSPVNLAIAGIVAGVTLLGAAWAGNWGDIQGKTFGAIEFVRGKLQLLADWFAEHGPAIRAFAEDTFGRVLAKIVAVARDIGGFVVEQFRKLSAWFQENQPLIQGFGEKVGAVLAALVGGFLWLWSRGQEALLGLWFVIKPILNGVIDLVLTVATAILQAVDGDWAAAWETLGNIPTVIWETLKATFLAFANWVTGWFGTSWAAVVETWRQNWELFKEILSLAWENIKTAVSAKLVELATEFLTWYTNFTTTWQTNWTLFKDTLVLLWENLKTAVVEKLRAMFAEMGLDFDVFKERWTLIWEDIKLILTTIWADIYVWVTEKINSLVVWIQENLTIFQTWWEEKWTEFKDGLAAIWTAIYKFVTDKLTQLKTAFETRLTEIKAWWETKWTEIKTTLEAVWLAMKQVVVDKLVEIKTAVTDKINEVESWISGKVAAFRAVGTSLMEGLKEGVTGAAEALITSVTGVIEDAIAAAKALLGIESPSKVFKGFGINTLMGFVQGADSMATRLQNSLTNAINPAVQSLDREMLVRLRGSSLPGGVPALAAAASGGTAVSGPINSNNQSQQAINIYGPIYLQGVDGPEDLFAKLQAYQYG